MLGFPRGCSDFTPHIADFLENMGHVRSHVAIFLKDVPISDRTPAIVARKFELHAAHRGLPRDKGMCSVARRQHPRDKGACSITQFDFPRDKGICCVAHRRFPRGSLNFTRDVANFLKDVWISDRTPAIVARMFGLHVARRGFPRDKGLCSVARRQHPRDKGACSITRRRLSRGSLNFMPHVVNIRENVGISACRGKLVKSAVDKIQLPSSQISRYF